MQITRFTTEHLTDDHERIEGYGAVFYDGTEKTEYKNPDGYIERISPEAFDESLLSGQPIESRFNHSRDFVLGRSDLGTAFFKKDEKGLKYSVPYDADDPDHQKVKSKIKKGLIRGSSFVGNVKKTDLQITRNNGKIFVLVRKIKLTEAGPVDNPCYVDTDATIKRYVEDWEEKNRLKEETEKRIKIANDLTK